MDMMHLFIGAMIVLTLLISIMRQVVTDAFNKYKYGLTDYKLDFYIICDMLLAILVIMLICGASRFVGVLVYLYKYIETSSR